MTNLIIIQQKIFEVRGENNVFPIAIGIDLAELYDLSGIKASALLPDHPVAPGDEKKSNATQFNPVVLRKAVEHSTDSALRQWILQNLDSSSPDELREVLIEVLNEEHKPELIISLKKVTAAGWQLGELNADKSELLMEEITLRYESIGMDIV